MKAKETSPARRTRKSALSYVDKRRAVRVSTNGKIGKGRLVRETDGHIKPSFLNQIIEGDAREVLRLLPAASVDLIVTSPPYADRRKRVYGGISPDKYAEWFLPFSGELVRVLKPTGSFVLNIKEIVVDGERHPYVIELILAMKRQGWLWTEEYVWHKKNCYPGKWPNRFRDAWERCLHFTRSKHFAMHQEEVRVPMGAWRHDRLRNLSATDKRRDNSRVGSGFGKKIENWVGRELAYPTNVLHMATECGNKGHAATFPVTLPAWFIRLFTKPGDVVLDPFVGSGTSGVAAKQLGRRYIGIDISADFCKIARGRIAQARVGQRINGQLDLYGTRSAD